MVSKKEITSALDKGLEVILVKAATRRHPRSYSKVVRYEGDFLWRTPFEAEDLSELKDFDAKKFTFNKDLIHNSRIELFLTRRPTIDFDDDDFDDDDFDDDDCNCCQDCAPVRVAPIQKLANPVEKVPYIKPWLRSVSA